MKELYKRFRPKSLSTVAGQPVAVKMLQSMLEAEQVPHSILFTGPSGTGKTTIARIMLEQLECGDYDAKEMNCANFRGIDMVREIQKQAGMSPMMGSCKVWIIDEAHQLTTAAQDAFLKLLEDTPDHVYFFLCTTDPEKLKDTIKTRCTEIALQPIKQKVIERLLYHVGKKASIDIAEDVADAIKKVADGSARKALVLLEQVQSMPDDEQADFVINSDKRKQAVELVRLFLKEDCMWRDVVKILETIDEEPELIRRMILSYCNTLIIRRGKLTPRAFEIIDAFLDNFYDPRLSGLYLACWQVTNR